MILEQVPVMVSALVVCAVVLQNNSLGSMPTVYNFSMEKYFFPAQTKPCTLAANQVCLGKKTVEELFDLIPLRP